MKILCNLKSVIYRDRDIESKIFLYLIHVNEELVLDSRTTTIILICVFLTE